MAITGYSRTCGKNVPGNRDKVYLTEVANVDSITVADGEVTAITMAATKHFHPVQADIDGVGFTMEGEGKTNYRETQNLEMHFSRKTKELVKLKESLVDGVTCGLAAIRVDGNGQAFLIGINDKEGKYRPLNSMTTNFDSGRELTDDDAQKYTLTLTRVSGYDEIPLNTALNASVLDGSAAFIDW